MKSPLPIFLITTLCLKVAVSSVMHGCPAADIPPVANSEHNYRGNNSVGATITYQCDFLSKDAAGQDKLKTTCGADGLWTSTVSPTQPTMTSCPSKQEVCIGEIPVVHYATIEDKPEEGSRPLIGAQVKYKCLVTVSNR